VTGLSGPKDEFVEVNGLRLHYRDWGGSGRPVVLLHGLASTSHIWDLVAPLLSQDHAVVALDQRGHGESDKPDEGYDFATVGSDLQGFIHALELERPVLAGHSWGGDVALEHAVAYPGTASGLALVDGGTIEISSSIRSTLEEAKKVMAPPDFRGTTIDEFVGMVRSRPFAVEMTDTIEQIVLSNFEVLDDRTIRARLSRRNHMQIIEAFWNHRPSELYASVRCPVLLMPARQPNEQIPQAAMGFDREEAISNASRLLPVSETVWLEDSIHDVPIQRPELVASVISERIEGGFLG
jgi:pimeloyl-ACP methyl ester carboxylesterase